MSQQRGHLFWPYAQVPQQRGIYFDLMLRCHHQGVSILLISPKLNQQ
jgi:hypothetical protein